MSDQPKKGILFKAPMVLALLNTKPNVWPAEPIDPAMPFKWQTRRLVKPQPEYQGRESFGDSWKWSKGKDWFSGVTTEQLVGHAGLCFPDRVPYQVGDVLFVRETFLYRAQKTAVIYRANLDPCEAAGIGAMYGGWKPSIFMPRSASRIWVQVKRVRVEKVNAITEEDAKAEGIEGRWHPNQSDLWTWRDYSIPGRFAYGSMFKANHAYGTLWDSINGKGDFDKGPWCFCYDLMRVK